MACALWYLYGATAATGILVSHYSNEALQPLLLHHHLKCNLYHFIFLEPFSLQSYTVSDTNASLVLSLCRSHPCGNIKERKDFDFWVLSFDVLGHWKSEHIVVGSWVLKALKFFNLFVFEQVVALMTLIMKTSRSCSSHFLVSSRHQIAIRCACALLCSFLIPQNHMLFLSDLKIMKFNDSCLIGYS
ncbi:hypothetical protein VNO78_27166 [Psophocarpus tetragonolobus]|uniref:Uncharacterized protein n=1 Tax=Psophocarpus tetragonolobus TaxID=3891 RepID=A0AAN9S2Z9_PSOTE